MWLLAITTRQWSLGQGNVLHLSVSHSVHREIGFPASSLHRGRSACRGICIRGGSASSRIGIQGCLPCRQTRRVCPIPPGRRLPRSVCLQGCLHPLLEANPGEFASQVGRVLGRPHSEDTWDITECGRRAGGYTIILFEILIYSMLQVVKLHFTVYNEPKINCSSHCLD